MKVAFFGLVRSKSNCSYILEKAMFSTNSVRFTYFQEEQAGYFKPNCHYNIKIKIRINITLS